MRITEAEIKGVYILEPRVFSDPRGYFFESYSKRELEDAIGKIDFVQDNESCSVRGVIRGLHFQIPPYSQAKLVRCIRGKVRDVAVDLRKDSETYGNYVEIDLSEENHRELYIPHGFAHGFEVLSDTAVFIYKCDNYYHPEAESGINLFDPTIGIKWEIEKEKAILSPKDINLQAFDNFKTPF